MLFDLNGSPAHLGELLYDVCVCGTGPAGITVAMELAAVGKRVLLLEAGGLEYSQQSQDQFKGSESGINTWNLALTAHRLRFFGGTSNHWTGLCGLLNDWDFSSERYHALPGWPIRRQEINAYQKKAADILDIRNPDFTSKPLVPGKQGNFEVVGFANSAPTRFGKKYRKAIFDSSLIHLVINANVVDILLNVDGAGARRVDHVVAKNYKKQATVFKAKKFVLALGAIENARALLNARSQDRNGVGNQSDFVGRCYMEHLNIEIGRFVSNGSTLSSTEPTSVAPTVGSARRLKMGNGILTFVPGAQIVEGGRIGVARGAVRKLFCKDDAVKEFSRKFVDFNCSGDGIINSMIEQSPSEDSRVTLGKELDLFGNRQTHLNWVLSDADKKTVRLLGRELAKEAVSLDIARIKVSSFIVNDSSDVVVWPHAHQMGATRMSLDPKDGVVDVNCRVHGVDNLYVSGSSVFPTGGGINPTLTLVMLALRLSDHLRADV